MGLIEPHMPDSKGVLGRPRETELPGRVVWILYNRRETGCQWANGLQRDFLRFLPTRARLFIRFGEGRRLLRKIKFCVWLLGKGTAPKKTGREPEPIRTGSSTVKSVRRPRGGGRPRGYDAAKKG